MEIWGSGDDGWQWTTEGDAGEFAAEIVLRDDAPKGGFWRACSGSHTFKQMASTSAEVQGTGGSIKIKGSVDEPRERALGARKLGSPREFWTYIGWFNQFCTVEGTWTLKTLDNDKLCMVADLLLPATTVVANVRDPSHSTAQSLHNIPTADDSKLVILPLDDKVEVIGYSSLQNRLEEQGVSQLGIVVANAGMNISVEFKDQGLTFGIIHPG
ncbi:hypothetical protein TPAR_07133 [Tolypocladium paradoxum]|uniref:Uncharacterized protein n=1 Tax=Tolypocladium paradoxum TaxID=94208 RepID=A0A2S4KR46_9HYPO|nr:hypothetical protein TPAR_07133 [Tolypocladium paradoxum]